MKITRRQLRKIIQEMTYAGHLGIIPDKDDPIYNWENISSGLFAGLDSDLTDCDIDSKKRLLLVTSYLGGDKVELPLV